MLILYSTWDSLGKRRINTWRLGWQPKSRRVLTTCKWPLLTAMCNGVCLRLFLAFKSAPPLCSTSMTEPSSPNAAWCTARSPSLSWITISRASNVRQWPESYTHVNEVVHLIKANLCFQIHVVFKQQLQDVHVPVLTGCLHSSVSSTLPIHLPTDWEFN